MSGWGFQTGESPMQAHKTETKPPEGEAAASTVAAPDAAAAGAPAAPAAAPGAANGSSQRDRSSDRYRRLPTGAHGMAREEVESDQRDRLQRAMTELVAERGYQGVRILDLTQLAHVSRPTFYELYTDKEELLLSAYGDIAARTAETILRAFDRERSVEQRMRASMHAFADLAIVEPHAMSLFLLGAFGAGSKALERRKLTIDALERAIQAGGDTHEPLAADF